MDINNKKEILSDFYNHLLWSNIIFTNHYIQKVKKYINFCKEWEGIKIQCTENIILYLELLLNKESLRWLILWKISTNDLKIISVEKLKNKIEIKIYFEEYLFRKDVTFVIEETDKKDKILTLFIDNLWYINKKEQFKKNNNNKKWKKKNAID